MIAGSHRSGCSQPLCSRSSSNRCTRAIQRSRARTERTSKPTNPSPRSGRMSSTPSARANSPSWLTMRAMGNELSAPGKLKTTDRRGPAGADARAARIAASISRARMAISGAETLGLATVSMSAAVSPKSFWKSIGSAPSGRSWMFLSLESMSSRARPRSLASARTVTSTTDTPLREVDSIFSTSALEAIFSSILRVRSCSTFSAGAPGQGVLATATRTGISGSFRLGIHR